jgi:hypothetical protein
MIKKYNFYNLSLSITITFNKKILNENKKNKILEAYQSFGYNTTSIIKNIFR